MVTDKGEDLKYAMLTYQNQIVILSKKETVLKAKNKGSHDCHFQKALSHLELLLPPVIWWT